MADTDACDVAFPFLARDEADAADVNRRVSERLTTFFYSEQHGREAGGGVSTVTAAIFGEGSYSASVDASACPVCQRESCEDTRHPFQSGHDLPIALKAR